ncbi:MAG TPA: hypothetical protein PLT66_02440 [Bacillota bacterium]|nr:hypothetical protein [Bacillota bacterium]
MKKILDMFLPSFMFVLSTIMIITAFAASPVSQDGLTAALTSNKTTCRIAQSK